MNRKLENLKDAVTYPFQSWKTGIATSILFLLSLSTIALSESITYSIQMLSAGTRYWLPALTRRLNAIYVGGGLLSISITLLYSFLIAVTLTNLYTEAKHSGFKLRKLTGIGPGFIAAGCAGCGVGILSLVGATGAIALMPFQGKLIKLAGLTLLIYFLAKTGDPKTCAIES
ncbi:MAG: hypothetical protein ABEJ83_04095 [Candidatus Nanohaloarchaea archaeon]